MYKPPSNSIRKGRVDAPDDENSLRWHQVMHVTDLSAAGLPELQKDQTGVVLLGFACDEGVKRNQGRAGAAKGPEAIRKACMNFAWHLDKASFILIDGGDVECTDGKLEEAQEELANLVTKVMKYGYFPVILGGGHEVAYGGYKGVFRGLQGKNTNVPGVINFDAHFDLRDFTKGASSGTPFAQIAGLCAGNRAGFDYLCLGIQPHANTKSLFNKAEELNVSFLTGETLVKDNFQQTETVIRNFIAKTGPVYLTVDMDVFDMIHAPGVSAPAMPGVDKNVVFHLLKTVFDTEKVIACDIAEMNPEYDPDNRTVRLAAYLVYRVVNSLAYTNLMLNDDPV
ncbi:MAG: formimidoylglutamase [Bacteroidales bacterium]|jgi:formiminoglutamase